MRIRYTRAALEDLINIHEHIGRENPVAAGRVVASLRESVGLLGSFPDIGRTGTVSGTREFAVSRYPYVIIYQVVRSELHVLNFFHMARDRR